MDRGGQQLRYRSGIINSVALKSENKIGFCEMYRSKNTCLCMTVKDKKSEFDSLPECNGMCAKQNINIYIENYEATRNREKYDMKCDSHTIDSYPYYETIKSESKMSAINNLCFGRNLQKTKSVYSDTWGEASIKTDNAHNWESAKNDSNVTYYPYLNSSRPYGIEENVCVKNQPENKSSTNQVQVNISPRMENSLLYNEINKKYLCKGNTAKNKGISNSEQKQSASLIASGTVPSSACNNLYVAPPYFTVDKFVSQEQADIRRNPQSNKFYSRNFYNTQRMSSNIGFQEDHSIKKGESLLISNKEHVIGIKVLESPNIPLMRLETSIEPIGLDIREQHRLLPIKKEHLNYVTDCISAKIENNHTENVNIPYSEGRNRRNDFFQSKSNPITFSIDQYDRTEAIEWEKQNVYGIADFRATYNTPESSQHNIAVHDLHFNQYQINSTHEAYTKKTCSNMFPPLTKNIVRDVRKPNYRELINHVHALRSATSEDDLNMQIIKRTLNYNQQSKDLPNSVLSKKRSSKVIRCHEDRKFSRIQNSSIDTVGHRSVSCGTANSGTPLDLSVKTIKTKADSTENNSDCKTLLGENGYPPKFNFRPDFSESRSFMSSTDSLSSETNGMISNTFNINRSCSADLKTKVNMNVQSNSTECCNQDDNDFNSKKTAVDCSPKSEFMLQNSIPKVRGNIVCSLQNCTSPHIMQTCVSQESNKGTGIKLEVTLKRTIPFTIEDDNELLHKKICFKSFCHSDFNTSSFNQCSESPHIDFKATSGTSKTTSNIDSLNYALNGHIKQLNENKKSAQDTKRISTNEISASNSFIETKRDPSSIIAARIRTKAELKGFTFQEDKDCFHQKPLSNKENCHCNYDTYSSVHIDLSEWDNACNNFVDQLKTNCKNLYPEIKESKLFEIKNPLPTLQRIQADGSPTNISIDIHKSKLFEQKSSSEESNEHKRELKEVFVTTIAEPLALNRTTTSTSNVQGNIDINAHDNVLTEQTNLISSDFFSSKTVSVTYEHRSNEANLCPEENIPKQAIKFTDNIEEAQDSIPKSKTSRVSKLATKNKNKEQNPPENNTRTIDLTKISVVRLKREKYTSKRNSSCDKNVKFKHKNSFQINKTKENSTTSRHVNNIGRSFPSITKSTLRRKNISFECGRSRQQIANTTNDNSESKLNAITTRLRHQMFQQQNKTESIEKNNKMNKSKKKTIRLHRHQKSNDRELSNDPDKLYLEVYRYKRALKIPPNLITIKNPSTQRISASLPDLDLDLQNNLLKTNALHSNNEHEVEDVPKSIIDVLHSRVVKSKCHVKNIQKYSKNDHQHTSKLATQRCNNSKPNSEPLNLSESSNNTHREHRNVFETQILSSRTRMEYKMQLNKEVIREIFGGNERPASAPPEINTINSDFEIAFKKGYNEFCPQINIGIEKNFENENEDEHSDYRTCIQKNLNGSNYVIHSTLKEQAKKQSLVSNKCKRKRSGKPHRRKFSSGFDYLRKRKKSSTHTVYNYSHLKTRVENYITETNSRLKSENDVSREIQKWVLNKSVGQSALHKAARLGYIDVIVYCLEKMGLNPDHKDNAGYTPLHDACVNGSLEIARLLLQYGANHSEGAHSGIRPLHEASENGHIEIVRMLLSYGADPLLETYSGQTPLMLASDPEMNDFIQMHLLDVQVKEINKKTWRFPGPWKIFDNAENGYDAFGNVSSLEAHKDGEINVKQKNYMCADFHYFQDKKNNFINNTSGTKLMNKQNLPLKNDICEFEIFVDTMDAEGELFEFEESNMPLPPLYLLKDEGMEKWVLLSDLCSMLKVKSKDTLLNKIFPSVSPSTVSRAFIRELKMCEFLERATCLQLLCAGEKINICHSKVVLIQYNENVRKLLGVKTIFMKF